MSRFLIYGLVDPRTRLIRYVGLSSSWLTRPRNHKARRGLQGRTHKENWIAELLRSGLDYEIVVLDTVAAKDALPAAERFWIAYGRACGWPLTNATDGGEGPLGVTRSLETRAKMSRAAAGRDMTRLSTLSVAATRGKKLSPAHVAKLRGKKRSPETKARIAAARRGWTPSEVTRQRMSEAAKRRVCGGAV